MVQFAEVDALTWHAGTANAWGPGIEVEYLPGVDPEIWTAVQRDAVAHLVEWLISAGIPEAFYDGPRVNPAGFRGFLTHRSVQQPDAHSDWWPELPRVTQGDDDMPKGFFAKAKDKPAVYLITNGKKIHAPDKEWIDILAINGQTSNGWNSINVVPQSFLDHTPDA